MNPRRCPLSVSDFDLVECSLKEMPLSEVIHLTEQLFGELSASEKITYDINRYCSDYSDSNGRINFIKALIDNAVISPITIPYSYQRDPRLADLVRPKYHEYFLHDNSTSAGEATEALTDSLESVIDSISVSNPRWVHLDTALRKSSPDTCNVGDSVELLFDVRGYPEGASVNFDIFDASTEPAMRIDTVRGKNENGTARIQWSVADPNNCGDKLQLLFEGSARSKCSDRVPIGVGALHYYTVEVKDADGNPIENIQVEFTVGDETTVVRSGADGYAKLSAEDPTVDADVRILYERTEGTETTPVAADDSVPITVPEDQVTDEQDGFEIFLVDEDGKPLEGVNVNFSVGDSPKAIISDGEGKVFLSAEEAGDAETVEATLEMKNDDTSLQG